MNKMTVRLSRFVALVLVILGLLVIDDLVSQPIAYAIDLIYIATVILVVMTYAEFSVRRKDLKSTPLPFNDTQEDDLRLSCRRVMGTLIRALTYSAGGCPRCFVPWMWTEPHWFKVPNAFGQEVAEIPALCVSCWNDVGNDERYMYLLMYYGRVVARGYDPPYKNDDREHICEALYGSCERPPVTDATSLNTRAVA